MLDLGQIFRNFTTWTTVTWVSTMLVARVFDFHKAYTMIIDKLDKEKWLMEQCLSDEFYHRLAYHSDLCEQVNNNAKISPVLFAVNESLGQMKLCGLVHCSEALQMLVQGGTPVLICLVLVYVLTPSFLLPVVQRGYESYATHQFNRRCSPYKKNDDYEGAKYPPSDDFMHSRVKYV